MAAITVTWDEVDDRWEGNNGETVHHNGTTWEANLPSESPPISGCIASIDGGSVGEYINIYQKSRLENAQVPAVRLRASFFD